MVFLRVVQGAVEGILKSFKKWSPNEPGMFREL